jgi:DNA replication protein DnaC
MIVPLWVSLSTTATVDRLLHHSHVVVTQGDSHRLAEASTGRGVVP